MSKKCINCGAELEDNALFCDECGAKQERIENIQKVRSGGKEQEAPIVEVPKKKRKGKLSKLVIGIAAIFLALGIIGGSCGNDKESSVNELKNSSEEIVQKLQQFTDVEVTEGKCVFGYSEYSEDSTLQGWNINYSEVNEFVRFEETQIQNLMTEYFGIESIDSNDILTYDFDENVFRIYLSAEVADGTLSIITYDRENEEFILTIDLEDYEPSEEFETSLMNDGLAQIMENTLLQFENTLNENQISMQDISALRYGDIEIDPKSLSKKSEKVEVVENIEQNIDYGYIYGGILDYTISDVSARGGSTDYLMHALYDMNNDGYKELIIENGTCAADVVYEVYTTEGESATLIGKISSGYCSFYKEPNGNGIYSDYCNGGYELINHYYIENGELIEQAILEQQTDNYGYHEGVAIEELKYPLEMKLISEFNSDSSVIEVSESNLNETGSNSSLTEMIGLRSGQYKNPNSPVVITIPDEVYSDGDSEVFVHVPVYVGTVGNEYATEYMGMINMFDLGTIVIQTGISDTYYVDYSLDEGNLSGGDLDDLIRDTLGEEYVLDRVTEFYLDGYVPETADFTGKVGIYACNDVNGYKGVLDIDNLTEKEVQFSIESHTPDNTYYIFSGTAELTDTDAAVYYDNLEGGTVTFSWVDDSTIDIKIDGNVVYRYDYNYDYFDGNGGWYPNEDTTEAVNMIIGETFTFVSSEYVEF